MNILLCPHKTPYFGQDFTGAFVTANSDLVQVRLKNGEYDRNMLSRPDVKLIVSRYPDLLEDLLVIRKYYTKIPIAVHLHLHYNFLNQKQKEILSETISKATILITNCRMLNDEYKAIFPQYKWMYINNGIDPNVYKPTSEAERKEFKEKLNIPLENILLSYTGRLNIAKGLPLLELVMQSLNNTNKYTLLVQTIFLEKYEQVYKKISQQFPRVRIYFDQDIKIVRFCDCHISTSFAETTSLVTLEALFSGVPTICTNITRFYDEIEYRYAPFQYFKKIIMPVDSFVYSNEKNGIQITASSLNTLAKEFTKEIENFIPLNQVQRSVLAQNFRRSRYNATKMLRKLHTTYMSAKIDSR